MPMPQLGCSSGPSQSSAWLALLLAPLAVRLRGSRGRALAWVVAFALPGLGFASEPPRQEAPAKKALVVVTGEVLSRRTVPPSPGQRLLYTEVEVAVRSCLKGGCGERLVFRVPGGRVGDLEQLVDGARLPDPGELVGVTVQPAGAVRSGVAAVYRLEEARDFVAFAQGLSAAGLGAAQPFAGSAKPPRSPRTLRPEP
jgi:hypothetical protein